MDFEEVYNKYAKDVFKFCLSLCHSHATAEDLTSETFIKAIQSCDRFKGQCAINVWLCQIAKNTYYDYLRKHTRIVALSEDTQSENDFVSALLDKEDALKIHMLLHKLEAPYKEVFSLRIFAELSFADIGKIFTKSESWARVTFHRAKLKLKEVAANGRHGENDTL